MSEGAMPGSSPAVWTDRTLSELNVSVLPLGCPLPVHLTIVHAPARAILYWQSTQAGQADLFDHAWMEKPI